MLGIDRSPTATHDWVQKADLKPSVSKAPNQIALDETVIRINDERYWLYAAVDLETNEVLHVRLFQTRTTQLTVLFLRELREKQPIEQAMPRRWSTPSQSCTRATWTPVSDDSP